MLHAEQLADVGELGLQIGPALLQLAVPSHHAHGALAVLVRARPCPLALLLCRLVHLLDPPHQRALQLGGCAVHRGERLLVRLGLPRELGLRALQLGLELGAVIHRAVRDVHHVLGVESERRRPRVRTPRAREQAGALLAQEADGLAQLRVGRLRLVDPHLAQAAPLKEALRRAGGRAEDAARRSRARA